MTSAGWGCGSDAAPQSEDASTSSSTSGEPETSVASSDAGGSIGEADSTSTSGADDASSGGSESTGDSGEADAYEWDLPPGFPEPFVPESNPMTEDKVELGRHLFYERRLSGNETQSCGDCHFQELAFADGLVTPTGSTGDVLHRNSLGLTNSAYSFPLTWVAPTLPTLEQQILVPIFGEFPTELGAGPYDEEIMERLRRDPLYQDLYAAAFPDEVDPYTWGNTVRALASFVRTLISGNSRFDRYTYQGDETALSESEIRGMNLFYSERLECHHCHGGFNFTMATKTAKTAHNPISFANTGLYNIGGNGDYPPGDGGLIQFTNDPEDMGKFRAPTLRNVALSAPYGHDGSVATLEDMIRIYERGGRLIEEGPYAGDGALNPYKSGFVPGFTLTDQEREDLIAFLEALTDETFITDPRFSNPFER